ncbi:SpoIIE family protein phosphatase [Streptomyces californicus]
MNFTRWSARLSGTQRRAAAGTERPQPRCRPPEPNPPGRTAHPVTPPRRRATPPAPETAPGPTLDDLSAFEIIGRLPAPVALLHGADHKISYVNEAYAAASGRRPWRHAPPPRTCRSSPSSASCPASTRPAHLTAPRSSRRTAGGSSYTVTCRPVTGEAGGEGVVDYATDVTNLAEAAERLGTGDRRYGEIVIAPPAHPAPCPGWPNSAPISRPSRMAIELRNPAAPNRRTIASATRTTSSPSTPLCTFVFIGDGWAGVEALAAAVMGQLRTAVRAYARLDLPPHEVIQLLDVLAAEIDASQIATCVYAVHDPNEEQLVYASAGHLPILVADEDGTVHRAADPTGPPLGTGGWVHTSGTIALPPGSTAVLYTDGLVERRSEDIDEGVASLARALSGARGTPQVVCDRLIRSLGVTAEHDDDVAVLVVQHPARTGADAELFHNAALDLLGGIEAAPRARAFATGVLASWRFPVELCDLGVLATSELVANSLQHGTPPMRLGLRRTDRRLIIEVTDGDDHLPRRRQAEPVDEAGRGISIIASIATSWGSRRTPGGGKAVWCEFALPR